MSTSNDTRDRVSKAYAEAVNAPAEDSTGCCSSATPKGVAAKLAGYTKDELDTLPSDAVVNSFGCGNPIAHSGFREGDVVLDLGSGAGIDVLLAAKKVGPTGRAIGIDMTDDMIARAQENISAAGLTNVEIRRGIIEELPVENESVDWVISNCVINLSPEKERVFAEVARVLKPGGQMLVSDIVAQDLPEWVMTDANLYNSCIGGAISEAAYLDGLRKAGLVDVEVRDRLVYDASHLGSLCESETGEAASSCCGPAPETKDMSALSGKVWSALVYAKKGEEA